MAERYLSQVEAARQAGVSKDSVIRARRAGRLAGARLVEGRWMIPADALDDAGFRPTRDDGYNPTCEHGGADADDEHRITVEMARAQSQVALLRDLVARQDEELRFLRQLLTDAIAGRGTT